MGTALAPRTGQDGWCFSVVRGPLTSLVHFEEHDRCYFFLLCRFLLSLPTCPVFICTIESHVCLGSSIPSFVSVVPSLSFLEPRTETHPKCCAL